MNLVSNRTNHKSQNVFQASRVRRQRYFRPFDLQSSIDIATRIEPHRPTFSGVAVRPDVPLPMIEPKN